MPDSLHQHGRPVLGLLLVCLCLSAYAVAPPRPAAPDLLASGLSDADVSAAEKVLARLKAMRVALAEAGEARRPDKLYRRFYPALFVAVAELRESELKTELDTAVFLSERLVKTNSAPDAAADCARERPDTYRPLCESLPGATVHQLLWMKAGLHARWAEALVRRHRGASDAETRTLLNSLAAARLFDIEAAGRALQGCERARSILSAHPLVNGRRVGGLPGSVAIGDAARALSESRRLASTLPRSPLWYRLSNAISAYEDGLYWLARLEQAKSPVVSAQGPAEIALREIGIPDEVAGAAVRGNFRQAEAYSNASGDLLRQLQGRYHACCP